MRDLEKRNLPVPTGSAAYSVNAGLWGVTIGGRETLDTTESIPEEAWVRTRGAFEEPRAPSRDLQREAPGCAARRSRPRRQRRCNQAESP